MAWHSPDGRLLAVGVSDYSVGVLDANTLSVSKLAFSFTHSLTIAIAVVIYLEGS